MSDNQLYFHELTGDYRLTGELARTLIEHAETRAKDPCDLLADIIETVLKENLIDAVLDDRA